jgi:hypothetical protein
MRSISFYGPQSWFSPKSEDSLGDVEIDSELVEALRGHRARATGPFVIETDVPPRLDATWERYRCTSIFEGLIRWLRSKGVNTTSPLHTLRKEYGSWTIIGEGSHAEPRSLTSQTLVEFL